MHALVNEEHGHDSVLANYVEQIKEKDLLIKERDDKLQELANQNGLLESEKQALRKELENMDKRSVLTSSQVNRQSVMGVQPGAGADPETA